MPSVFTHIAVPGALAAAFGEKRIPRPLWQVGMLASVIPDLDCIAFALGIPYENQFGHRGFTHSIAFAAAFAALWTWRNMEFTVDGVTPRRSVIFAFLFVCTASHPLLDAMTDGGHGIALLWPFTTERYFFPWREIPVSPLGAGFVSARGLAVLLAEFKAVWLPCIAFGAIGWALRRLLPKRA